RIFNVSLSWLMAFAQQQWATTPADLGLDQRLIYRIKKLQVFGLQADEMWSFVQKKKRKRWIWVIYDPIHRLVIAYHIGDRSENSARVVFDKLPDQLKDCWFETDHWKAFKKIIPEDRHVYSKEFTYYIEGFFATVRARVSRLVRKSLSFSKSDKWHTLAIGYFFWQLNLERHPYI
ncbi:MAG: IS1 family transposase, partial [Bacteroidota bacterium]